VQYLALKHGYLAGGREYSCSKGSKVQFHGAWVLSSGHGKLFICGKKHINAKYFIFSSWSVEQNSEL